MKQRKACSRAGDSQSAVPGTHATWAATPLSRRGVIRAASIAAGAAVLLPVLDACGNSAVASQQQAAGVGTAAAKVQTMSGAQRQQLLEQQAADEGQVVMYSGDNPVLLQKWQNAFNQTYPKVHAQFVRFSADDGLDKVITEARLNKPVADLFHGNDADVPILEQAGLAAAYDSPQSQGFPAAYVDTAHKWVVMWIDKNIVGYNTKQVSRSDVPITIEELADPRWKGKIGTSVSGGQEFVAAILDRMGKSNGMAALQKLSGQDVRVYDSSTDLGNALSSGEVSVSFSFLLEIAGQLQAEGAPVGWVVPNPMVIDPGYQLLMKNAPHPYAAILAYDWLISKQAQAMVEENHVMSPRNDVPQQPYQAEAQKIGEQEGVIVNLQPNLFVSGNQYNSIFDSLFVT